MEDISKSFEFTRDTEEGRKMILYSAFYNYDELINCAIAGTAFLAGKKTKLDSKFQTIKICEFL